MNNNICFLFILFCLWGCAHKGQPHIAFYYWKTTFDLDTTDEQTLENNEVKQLYVRYFDIDIDAKTKQPYPKAPIHFKQNIPKSEIIPVIFIKNKVFLQSDLNVQDLAQKTVAYIQQINQKNKITTNQIQLDCDWTLDSRANFFEYIESIKKLTNNKLSATIRLHQIKYFEKTGVPAVDRGVLMYYNMGKIAAHTQNSIYNKEDAQKYIENLEDYPLQLDVALPIYSWIIQSRNNQVVGLISKTDTQELTKNPNFMQTKEGNYVVLKSIYLKGVSYLKDDLLKPEKITKEDLLQMANDLSNQLKNKPKEIIFYDLDTFNTNKYEKNIFQEITSEF